MPAAAARGEAGRPSIVGAHLEGPFLGGAPGAHQREHIRGIDGPFLSDLPDIVRIVTIAPEAAGALEAITRLRQRQVTVSLGHSTASYAEARAAVDAGASLVTHLFNAMGPLHHRNPGLAGAALVDDRVAVALIADGAHVALPVLKLAFRVKGRGRVALVSDSVALESRQAG